MHRYAKGSQIQTMDNIKKRNFYREFSKSAFNFFLKESNISDKKVCIITTNKEESKEEILIKYLMLKIIIEYHNHKKFSSVEEIISSKRYKGIVNSYKYTIRSINENCGDGTFIKDIYEFCIFCKLLNINDRERNTFLANYFDDLKTLIY